jgi:hypothetical protein
LVEHPEVVAQRIEAAVAAVGDRERVIASSDCGFGTFAGWEWVAEDVVWAKLRPVGRVRISQPRACGGERATTLGMCVLKANDGIHLIYTRAFLTGAKMASKMWQARRSPPQQP